MLNCSEVIAKSSSIRKIDDLVGKFGGTRKRHRSISGFDISRLAAIHYFAARIAIVGVNPIRKWNGSGFAFQYLDSIDGQVSEGYAFLEKRPFNAAKGSHPATKIDLSDSPYLVAVVPAMELGDRSHPWHRRSIIHVTFIVGEFTPSNTRNTTLKSLETKLEFKLAPFPLGAKH